jgi:hypothetical protein
LNPIRPAYGTAWYQIHCNILNRHARICFHCTQPEGLKIVDCYDLVGVDIQQKADGMMLRNKVITFYLYIACLKYLRARHAMLWIGNVYHGQSTQQLFHNKTK